MSEVAFRIDRVGTVGKLTLSRAPHNFFDCEMLSGLADALADFDRDTGIRAVVLMSDQRNFCAGANFGGDARIDPAPIYKAATRLVSRRKPLVAAVKGAAVGGGLGLAMIADLRVGDSSCWMQANFTRIGISPGFGLSYTLPKVIGAQRARDMLLTGRRVSAGEASSMGLLDRLVGEGKANDAAQALAAELAANSPAAMSATRRSLPSLDESVFAAAIARELAFQEPLFAGSDFEEGVRAANERRAPSFSAFQEP
jgi:2-(1,2-epoxy-1,2-dihydrophenyl)acetyl-CoA isomerase